MNLSSIVDTDIEKRRERAEKCDLFAKSCRERVKELLAQANAFDLEAAKARTEANRLEALQLRQEGRIREGALIVEIESTVRLVHEQVRAEEAEDRRRAVSAEG